MGSLQVITFSTMIKVVTFPHFRLGGTIMKFENSGLEKLRADLSRIDDVMQVHGLVRGGHWDYERVTYDKKFELKDGVFYLRVQGYSVEGDVDTKKAIIQLLTPLLGKYYYPHGVEYGEDEHFSKSLISQCEKILEMLKAEIEKFSIL